jgi:hypothetical protein
MTPAALLAELLTDLDRELAPGWAHRCLMGQPCPGCLRDRLRARLVTARKQLAEQAGLEQAT